MNEQQDQFAEYERRRRLFLDEWQAGVEPLTENVREAARGAVSFAQTALRAMFVLNGGALVLLPAYITALDLPLDLSTNDIMTSSVIYASGLTFAALGTLIAYFTMVLQSSEAWHAREALSRTLHNRFPDNPAQPAPFEPITIKEYQSAAKKRGFWAESFRWTAIAATLLSLASFVAGSYFAARAMFESAAQATESSYGA